MAKKDPLKGTGKKPKGSGRRLYTDENPKDTVSIKYATVADAKATVAKVKRVNKPFARKIQILTVLEQRAKVQGKTDKPKSRGRPKKTSEPKIKRKRDGLEKMTKQIRKKIKKVAKGLSKASKTHARQAKALRSVLKTKKAKT